MNEQSPGSADNIDRHISALSRDLEAFEDFANAKTVVFAYVQTLKDTYLDDDDIDSTIQKLIAAAAKLVDQYIQLSHQKLDQPDRLDQAVDEWIDMVLWDINDQDERTFQIVSNSVTQPPESANLKKYAWSYIKEQNLDIYDEFKLDNRTDLNDESWVLHGYAGLLYQRIYGILEYGPEEVVDRFQQAWEQQDDEQVEDSTPPEKAELYSHLEVYVANLPVFAEDFAKMMHGFDYGPAPRYLDAISIELGETEMLQTFEQGTREIRKIVLANADKRRYRNREQTCYLLRSPAFVNGFVFGMAVNNRLLSLNDDPFDVTAVNTLIPQTQAYIDNYKKLAKKGENIDAMVYEHGKNAFAANIAHEKERFAIAANELENPLNDLATSMISELYDPYESEIDAKDFKAGFGTARDIYNAYRYQMTQELQSLYYS